MSRRFGQMLEDEHMPKTPTRLLTIPEVARRLAVSERQVWRFIAEGDIPAIRLRGSTRVAESDLDEWLERNRT